MQSNKPVVLIVEDDRDVAYLVQDVLEGQGADCVIERQGEAVLARALEVKPALILLDIKLPGIDGYTVCRRLKRADAAKEIPVVFISALNSEDDVIEAREAGGIYYIAKPFDIDFLIHKVKEILAAHLPEEPAERLSVGRHVLYVNAGYTVGTDQFLDPVKRYLEPSEFHLTIVDDPQDTLRLARKVHPDVILLDMDQSNLPLDDFLDVLARHPMTERTPIVLLSELVTANSGLIKEGGALVRAVVPKPVREERLLSVLREAVVVRRG